MDCEFKDGDDVEWKNICGLAIRGQVIGDTVYTFDGWFKYPLSEIHEFLRKPFSLPLNPKRPMYKERKLTRAEKKSQQAYC